MLGYEVVALPVVLREGRRGDRPRTLVLLPWISIIFFLFMGPHPQDLRFIFSIQRQLGTPVRSVSHAYNIMATHLPMLSSDNKYEKSPYYSTSREYPASLPLPILTSLYRTEFTRRLGPLAKNTSGVRRCSACALFSYQKKIFFLKNPREVCVSTFPYRHCSHLSLFKFHH